MVSIVGCAPQTIDETPDQTSETPKEISSPAELVGKRGIQTNITEFNELLVRASKISEYKYTLHDSDIEQDYKYYFKGRFVKVELPMLLEHETGEVFNTVYMERTNKYAFTRCNREVCPEGDMEFEVGDYDYFYRPEPYEILSMFRSMDYVGDEMIGNDYVKVFSGTYLGNQGRIYVQEYWGYPLKLEYVDDSNTKHTIEFLDMEIDNTRIGEVQMPPNFKIKGEKGSWWNWEHYLGELKTNTDVDMPGLEPQYGV